MHERQRRNDARVLQILVIRSHLMGQQHALVHDSTRRHRGHVELLAVSELEGLYRVAGRFPDDVELAFESVRNGDAFASSNEYLPNDGLNLLDGNTEAAVVARHIAPAQQYLALVLDRSLDLVFARKP